MKQGRWTNGSLLRALCVALGAIGTSSCVDEQAFIIVQNQIPVMSQGSCMAGTDEGVSLTRGLLDVAGRRGYYMFPLIANNLIPSTRNDPTQPERHRLEFREFRIKLNLQNVADKVDANLPREYKVPVSGSIEPGGTARLTVKVIPDAVAQALPTNGEISIELRAVAEHGGVSMESGPLVFPIELCAGCLIGQVLETCPTETISTSNACGLPQDGPVLCCKVPGGSDVVCLPNGASPFKPAETTP